MLQMPGWGGIQVFMLQKQCPLMPQIESSAFLPMNG